jgi:hypothetical protein
MPPDSAAGSRKSVAFEVGPGLFARFFLGDAVKLHAEDHVIEHGSPRQQHILLQHVADEADHAADPGAVKIDFAARRFDQPGDDIEDGRLAAAGRPEDADESPARDVDRHVVDRIHCGTDATSENVSDAV